ncbi:MAG: ABC transporter ATP-binding protein [Vicinamibacterales bacterium]
MISYLRFRKQFGPHVAVENLTLDVGRGEAVVLLGPNGSGKTTTLKAAAGLIRPSAGEVRLGEPGVPAWEPSARRCCSFLPQKVAFPESLSGREVVDFHRVLRGVEPARTDEVLAFASLNGAGGRAVHTYSGGMVQRLGLAVAMLPDAPVLLLDEPTAALDPDGLCAFYGLVDRRKSAGKTVLFTTHQLGDAERLADRIAILVEGRLVAVFANRELAERLADRGLMRLALDSCPETTLESVRRLAARATWNGHAKELVVPCRAAVRAEVVQAVRESGAAIRSLVAEEGRLDALYMELVKEKGR